MYYVEVFRQLARIYQSLRLMVGLQTKPQSDPSLISLYTLDYNAVVQ